MRKLISIAGPLGGALAFKCPLCVLFMLGGAAALGPAAAWFRVGYWLFAAAMAALFLGSLVVRWRAGEAPRLAVLAGALGLAGLAARARWPALGLVPALASYALVLGASLAFLPRCRCAQPEQEKCR